MKTLVVFQSKNGTTEECAQLLAERLGKKETDLVDLKVQKLPGLEQYDCIVLGSRIRYGKIGKRLMRFISAHKETLKGKKLGIFLCMGVEEEKEKTFEKNFDSWLRTHAVVQESFGGALLPDKLKGSDKKIAELVLGAMATKKQGPPRVCTDRIDQFAETLLK